MNLRARTSIAAVLACAGLFGFLVADFFGGVWPLEISLVLLAVSLGLIALGALVRPPFWWGARTFTTPLADGTHVAKAPTARAGASKANGERVSLFEERQ
jgi:hypothetical protein